MYMTDTSEDYTPFNPDNREHQKLCTLLHKIVKELQPVEETNVRDKVVDTIVKGKDTGWDSPYDEYPKWKKSTTKIMVHKGLQYMEDDPSWDMESYTQDEAVGHGGNPDKMWQIG